MSWLSSINSAACSTQQSTAAAAAAAAAAASHVTRAADFCNATTTQTRILWPHNISMRSSLHTKNIPVEEAFGRWVWVE
jgi:hypothetical protein